MTDFEPVINLSVDKLIDECSLGKKTKEEIKKYLNDYNDRNIHEVFRYRRFNDGFTDKVTCYNNGGAVIGLIRPSYSEFLLKLAKDLNIDSPINCDNLELTKAFSEKLDEFREIKSERVLKENFPTIFNSYMEGKLYINAIEDMRKETLQEQYDYNLRKKYYYSCGMRRSIVTYIPTQSELYRRFIMRRFDYKEVIEEDNLMDYFRENFDQDKMAMYITYKYLCICNSTDDLELKNNYFKLVKNYFNSTYDKNVTVNGDDDNKINANMLMSKALEIRKELEEEKENSEVIIKKRNI